MATDLTFQQINDKLGFSAFSYSGGNITLDTGTITSDTYTSLDDSGVLEFAFKLFKICYEAQEQLNENNPNDEPLTSFNRPFYSNVENSDPPVTIGSCTVDVAIPLNIDSIVGVN